MTHDTICDNGYLDELATRWLGRWESLDIDYPKLTESEYTSDEALKTAMRDEVVAAGSFGQAFNEKYFEDTYTGKDSAFFTRFLAERFPNHSIMRSGFFYYPPGQGMGWHTNADTPYLRCYMNYSLNGDSYFKFYDQKTQKTVVDHDVAGWNIRTFDINREKGDWFWHSVYSNTHRISAGFKIINNLK